MKQPDSRKHARLDWAAVAGRWLLGGLFLYMGLVKALHPEYFLKQVEQYKLLHDPVLLNSIAAALPWFEAFCGVLLLMGIAVRGTAALLIGMLIPFTAAILRRALAIAGAKSVALCAVKFDCGCGLGEVFACHKVVENTALILVACWLLAGWGRTFALRYSLTRPPTRQAESLPEEQAVSRP